MSYLVANDTTFSVKLSFDYLEKTMARLKDVIASKVNGREDQQNLIFKLIKKEEGYCADVMAVAGQTVVRISTGLDVTLSEDITNELVQNPEANLVPQYIQVRNKEVTNALAGFKSLFITKPTNVEFEFGKKQTVMKVYEQSIDFDPQEDTEDLYSNVSTFKLISNDLAPTILEEVKKAEFRAEGEVIETPSFLLILDFLLPQIANEKTIGANNIIFEEKYVFTRATSHVTVLPNSLATKFGDCLTNFKLDNTTVGLVRALIKDKDTFILRKDDSMLSRDSIILEIEADDVFVRLVVPAASGRFNLEPYLERKQEGNFTFTINKLYLNDILKRAGLGKPVTIEYANDPEKGTHLTISTEGFKQDLPVLFAESQGSIRFNTRSDFFLNMACAYLTDSELLKVFSPEVTVDVWYRERGKADIMVYDATNVWTSKVVGVRAN